MVWRYNRVDGVIRNRGIVFNVRGQGLGRMRPEKLLSGLWWLAGLLFQWASMYHLGR